MTIRTPLLALAVISTAGFAQVPYPGNDADNGVARASGFIDPYTGNLSFSTADIRVAGAVGKYGLQWSRHATSRTSQTEKLLGLGHNWAHGWQWEMVDAGQDSEGRAVIAVHNPQGWSQRFAEIAPGEWASAPSITTHIVEQGDSFVFQRGDSGAVRFTRERRAGGVVFVLTEVSDSSGNAWALSWKDGRLVQVTEPAGRWLKISYRRIAAESAPANADRFPVISEVAASDGQKVKYHYTFEGGGDYPILSKVEYPDGTSATYTYATPRAGIRTLLVQAVDPRGDRQLRGRIFRYRAEADSALGQTLEVSAADDGAVMDGLASDTAGGRSYAVRRDNGSTVYRTFNAGGNIADEIDALGYSKKHEYDANGRGLKIATTDELGNTTRIERDANGKAVKTTFPDGSTRLASFDSKGRVLSQTDEIGHSRTFTRDSQGRVVTVGFPDGSDEEITYNTLGQVLTRKDRGGAVTTFTYDERGLQTKMTNALGHSTLTAYDAQDRVAAMTDPRGNVTRYEYDAAGRVTKTIWADGASNITVYDAFGQVVKSTDAAGATRTHVYDRFGRMNSIFNALGHKTLTVYAQIGKDAPFNRPVQTISPSGGVKATAYDANGRVIARTVAAGTREAATTRFAYDAAGRQTAITDPRGKTVQFFHDVRGRRTKVMSALNHVTSTEYDVAGRKLSQTDAKGNTTRWTYDAMGREFTRTDAKNQVTRREYGSAGRLAALIDAKGNTYRFEFDALGQRTALVYPDGSRETTTLDEAGNNKSDSNRAGMVRIFEYDNRNREIASEWSDGSQRIVKAYDATGRMTLEDNGVSKLTFVFDSAGRLVSETQDLSPVVTDGASDPAARTVSYTYNADGQRETLGYPDGTFVKFAYNGRGQLAQILGNGLPPIASYEYDLAGNAIRMPRENDVETKREHDAENKLTAITERAADHSSPLSELDYTYDEVGNRTSAASTIRGQRTREENTLDAYRYDETYQVTGADYDAPVHGNRVGAPAAAVRFTYDSVGNRVEVDENGTVTRYTTNNLNQYTQVGEFAPTYERNGNLAAMGRWLYRYDAMNRLVEASNGTMTVKFWYDAKNRCVARSYNSSTALNYYDRWNLIAEYDRNGTSIARHVRGRRVDEIVMVVNRHGVYYPHVDAIGNVTMLTDTKGKLVERYTYTAAGQPKISNAAGQSIARSGVDNRWMFTGREWLEEVGLYDYRNRLYSASMGRFLQTDPIRFAAGDVNIYRYVFNRSLQLTDPFGLGPGDYFMSAEAAAMDASNYFRTIYGAATNEYGTYIIQDSPGYTYGNLVTQGHPTEVDLGEKPLLAVATWHNHTRSDDFSSRDIEGSDTAGLDAYMLAPNNEVQYYNNYTEASSWWSTIFQLFGFIDPTQTIGQVE